MAPHVERIDERVDACGQQACDVADASGRDFCFYRPSARPVRAMRGQRKAGAGEYVLDGVLGVWWRGPRALAIFLDVLRGPLPPMVDEPLFRRGKLGLAQSHTLLERDVRALVCLNQGAAQHDPGAFAARTLRRTDGQTRLAAPQDHPAEFREGLSEDPPQRGPIHPYRLLRPYPLEQHETRLVRTERTTEADRFRCLLLEIAWTQQKRLAPRIQRIGPAEPVVEEVPQRIPCVLAGFPKGMRVDVQEFAMAADDRARPDEVQFEMPGMGVRRDHPRQLRRRRHAGEGKGLCQLEHGPDAAAQLGVSRVERMQIDILRREAEGTTAHAGLARQKFEGGKQKTRFADEELGSRVAPNDLGPAGNRFFDCRGQRVDDGLARVSQILMLRPSDHHSGASLRSGFRVSSGRQASSIVSMRFRLSRQRMPVRPSS